MENGKEKEVVIDIKAPTDNEEKKGKNNNLNGNQARKSLSKTTSGVLNYNNNTKSSRSEEHIPLVENTHSKVKKSKKPARPPLPPNAPPLNASDTKLVKHIYDIAMKRRAIAKRVQALNKSKMERATSSGLYRTTLIAMILTLIFIVGIILHGFLSRSISLKTTDGSPTPAMEPKGLLSVRLQIFPPKENI